MSLVMAMNEETRRMEQFKDIVANIEADRACKKYIL